jgi:probable rRNA maturation factor
MQNQRRSRCRTQVLNTQRRCKIHGPAVSAFCEGVLLELGVTDRALSVVFVNPRRMKELNLQFLGRNYATDVLSFSYPGEVADGLPWLGEVVIAPEVAWLQARRWRISAEKEMRKLLVHGLLHLLGYDHETDAGVMLTLQRRLLRRRALLQGGRLEGIANPA